MLDRDAIERMIAFSGLPKITRESPPTETERALHELRRVADEYATNPIRRGLLRDAAVRTLRGHVSGPAGLVDAALAVVPRALPAEMGQGQAIEWSEPEPAAEPVDGAALVRDLVALVRRYVVLVDEAAGAVALWTMHTWLLDAADVSPLLVIAGSGNSDPFRSGNSVHPGVRSGKTAVADNRDGGRDDRHAQATRDSGAPTSGALHRQGGAPGRRVPAKRAPRRG